MSEIPENFNIAEVAADIVASWTEGLSDASLAAISKHDLEALDTIIMVNVDDALGRENDLRKR